jgi:hypothetical protein
MNGQGGQGLVSNGILEREFPVLLTTPPKKNQKTFRANARKTNKKTKTKKHAPPKNTPKKHQKNPLASNKKQQHISHPTKME